MLITLTICNKSNRRGGLFAVQNIHLDVTDVYEPPPLKIYEFTEDKVSLGLMQKQQRMANDSDSNYLIYLANNPRK